MMTDLELVRPHTDSVLRTWLTHISPYVLIRSLVLAIIIGSTLTLTNQFSALFGNYSLELVTLSLTFFTPFLVVTLSQLSAAEEAYSENTLSRISGRYSGFIKTLMNHNIPARALLIALILGSVNSGIVLLHEFFQSGQVTSAIAPLLGQLYALPFIFGAISQTLTYRRHVAT